MELRRVVVIASSIDGVRWISSRLEVLPGD
jgi:hypothetical protein